MHKELMLACDYLGLNETQACCVLQILFIRNLPQYNTRILALFPNTETLKIEYTLEAISISGCYMQLRFHELQFSDEPRH